MRRGSQAQFWAVVLIVLGVIFLLVNLIPNAWSLVCPLALIGAGLFLLLGRNVAAFSASEVKTDRFTALLAGTTSAQVELGLSVGESHIHALSDAGNLIDANLTYIGAIDFTVTGEAEKSVCLRQKWDDFLRWLNPANWFRSPVRLRWDIGLSPHVPMTLAVSGGTGNVQLDLRELNLSDFHLSGGTGRVYAALPGSSAGYTAQIAGGTGNLNVEIPDGASVGLSLSGGTGAVRLNIGADAAVNAHLTGGTGLTTLDLPRDAAVHLSARTGVGSITVPPHFVRLTGGEHVVGQSGVWETPNFSEAARQISIEFTGGVGGLVVH